jgi:hypothetical protein
VEEVEYVFGPGARLKIARVTPKGLKYLATWHAAIFSLDHMLSAFGGGEYSVRVFVGSHYVQVFRVYLDTLVPPRDP